MSAPDTNIEKQTRRHKPSLLGIAVAVGIAAFVAIIALTWGGVPAEDQAAAGPVSTAADQ